MKKQKVKSNTNALSIAHNFKTMGNKFIHLNKKIDDLDSKVNKRIDVLDKKIDNLDIKHSLKFVDLETRIDNCVTKD